ncbi:hypothetical protein QN277_003884 [Acacia crassicarpa]|uniref:Protein kinase domain-containing protein n=1 Tax=Acacia crassicarpa TaxID=499986 RepID=A0AAE1IZA6_9FABA|nr:hypothetical protein QN277_003884 [Acacia crassicarpa]
MAAPSRLSVLVFCFFFLVSHLILPTEASINQDLGALMAFKAASDAGNKLASWNSSTHPCNWVFVSCLQNRVSRLVLENLDLHGSMEPLTSLTQLRVLSLKRNHFSGPIPTLSNFTSLKLLFLSYNEFSGEFPVTVTSLLRLYRLDLSHNNFSGDIPTAVNNLTHLLSLRLNDNQFSGHIPYLNLSKLQDFNVSGNHLSGEIPKSVLGFPKSSFAQNPSLCGAPLVKCKDTHPVPFKPDGSVGPNIASPLTPRSNPSTPVKNKTAPKTPSNTTHHHRHHNGASKMSPVILIAIIVGDVLILAIVSLLLYCCFWQNYSAKLKEGNRSKLLEGEKILYSSSPYPPSSSTQIGLERGQMVFFEGMKKFELEDLLRASAEMLGKGGFGTAYKAVLDDGNVVAVKRLKDAQINGKKEFEQHMEVLGRLRHPNIVSLRAYYYARDERLLVCDYMTNGSLFWLLHGNRGPGRSPLDWTTRLKIAAGVGRGLAFIHGSCKALRLIHGNIKSTNILIDQDGEPHVADFGLYGFAVPATKSNGYRAPEAMDGRKSTQKSDVYSFGVLLLELLTGKCPSVGESSGPGGGGAVDLPRWVQSVVREEWTAEVFDIELMRYKDIEEEMVGLLQIAMTCCAAVPDQRPRISHVVKMIEDIRGVEISPSHDTSDSVSESPSLSG